jgi:outer membrane protein assembly factor BamB
MGRTRVQGEKGMEIDDSDTGSHCIKWPDGSEKCRLSTRGLIPASGCTHPLLKNTRRDQLATTSHLFLKTKGLLLILLILAPAVLVASVSGAKPIPDFSASPVSGKAPLGVHFTDLSLNVPTGLAWFFGDETYKQAWTRLNESSGWQPRFEHSSVVTQSGAIVLTGGYDGNYRYNDTWRSTDNGATWTLVNASSGWTKRKGHSSTPFGAGIVLMGGATNNGAKNDTWLGNSNGDWSLINASCEWPARLDFSAVTMPDNSIWLMGGTDGAYEYNDVWLSTNFGQTWARAVPPGWTPRYGHSSVVMPDSSIVLTGGYDNVVGYKNDTWQYKNFIWTRLNASSGWSARSAHSTVAMPDGSIVLMGGYDGSYMEDVWRSTDNGTFWTQVNASAGWTARRTHSSVTMPDGSIVLMGGYDGNTKNDTWRFQPVGSSVPTPSHTYTTPGTYPVALQAYNANWYNSTRKAGYISVTEPLPVTEPSAGWKYRGELNNTGVYDDGGYRPNGLELWNVSDLTGSDIGEVWSSPTVTDGVVYVGDRNNTLFAIDANTGVIKWEYPLPLVAPMTVGNIWSSPAIANGTLYIGNGKDGFETGGAFYAFNASTGGFGTPLWQKNFPYGGVVSSPAVAYGNVYVGRQDHNVSAWNAVTGAQVWTYPTDYPVVSSPAVAYGNVYFCVPTESGGDNIFALDALTGTYVWDVRNTTTYDGMFGEGGDNVRTSPVIKDGVLYIGGLGGGVYAFDAATGDQLHKFNDGTGTYYPGVPAVANGLVYIGTEGASPHHFYALNADDLTLNWTNVTPDDTEMWSSPAVANGVVYVTSADSNTPEYGYLYAWDAITGVPKWNFPLNYGSGTSSSPSVANGVVYFGTLRHGIYAVGTEPHPPFFRQGEVGVFRNGAWYLDYSGNGWWDGPVTDLKYPAFGTTGDAPVAGDWNKNGISEVGVFRNGAWYLDYSGNGWWDGPVTDRKYPAFGTAGDLPVAGNWSGDGKIGVFRNGAWYLDYNGNGWWDGPVTDRKYPAFGTTGDIPVAGDLNGDKISEIGVFRNGAWYLDYNGNGWWDGPVTDRKYPAFGTTGDIPVTGDWDKNGISEIGVFRNGAWYLDYSGNGWWDGPVTDRKYPAFGTTGDKPTTGAWV